MKYKVETWDGNEERVWTRVHECDGMNEAFDRARKADSEEERGRLISRVVEIETGKVLYARGYIAKKGSRS